MGVLFLCMVCTACVAWCPGRSEEESGSPKIRIKDGCEPPCACWEWNLGPPKEQKVLLITYRDIPSVLSPHLWTTMHRPLAENQLVHRTSLF